MQTSLATHDEIMSAAPDLPVFIDTLDIAGKEEVAHPIVVIALLLAVVWALK